MEGLGGGGWGVAFAKLSWFIISKERYRPEVTVREATPACPSSASKPWNALSLGRLCAPRGRASPPPHGAASTGRGRSHGIEVSGRPSHRHNLSSSPSSAIRNIVNTTDPCEVVGIIPSLTSRRSARLWRTERAHLRLGRSLQRNARSRDTLNAAAGRTGWCRRTWCGDPSEEAEQGSQLSKAGLRLVEKVKFPTPLLSREARTLLTAPGLT